MQGLGQHAEQVDRLIRGNRGQREQRVLLVAAEHVSGHVLRRRHVLQRRVGKDLPRRLSLGDLEEKSVFERRVDLERVPESDLPVLETGVEREPLVDELRGEDRGCLFDRISRRQIVVLAGIDHDARRGVDPSRETLVDEGSHGVDVPEEDAVQRIVQHHVEPLERPHRRDLRHAESRAVVDEADGSVELTLELVEGRSHDPEVLLRRERPPETRGRRAERDVVEERLRGRPDHGDALRAGSRGGLRLDDVLVDVSGGDDRIEERQLLFRVPREPALPIAPVLPDPRSPSSTNGANASRQRGCSRTDAASPAPERRAAAAAVSRSPSATALPSQSATPRSSRPAARTESTRRFGTGTSSPSTPSTPRRRATARSVATVVNRSVSSRTPTATSRARLRQRSTVSSGRRSFPIIGSGEV